MMCFAERAEVSFESARLSVGTPVSDLPWQSEMPSGDSHVSRRMVRGEACGKWNGGVLTWIRAPAIMAQ